MKHRGIALLVLSVLVSGTAAASPPGSDAAVKRGAYLVSTMGCTDCHTPWKMGPKGPEPDVSRFLSGHPAEMKLPPAPDLGKGPWMASVAATMTAWAGPWGVSFTANLTPDPETGLGKWTDKQFVTAIRTGRHEGKGRPILPPMPWEAFKNATDADLKAIFAYLRTIKPIRNAVPQPIEPPAPPAPPAPPR
ncbi:MAG TPA: c-type cytochrome [Thermoanaerobaculia bacterium]|nr:c-type cytochrome [Thermoanaerobaculia bacterium]